MRSILFFLLLTLTSMLCFAGSEPQPAQPVCVSRSTVELHKAASEKSAVSWIVGRNMPLLKIGEQKDKQKHTWFEVRDLDGEKHFVRSNLVSVRAGCVVVRSKSARLRQGPGKDQPLADLEAVDKFTPFKKLDRDGEWVQIEDEYKGKYWVHEMNLWIPALRNSVSF